MSSDGDTDGGGSFQATFDPLVSKSVFEPSARFNNRLLRALNRGLQIAREAMHDTQGMGQNSCLQMIFLNSESIHKYKRVKEEEGTELADYVQALVLVQNMVDNGNIQAELKSNCLQAL